MGNPDKKNYGAWAPQPDAPVESSEQKAMRESAEARETEERAKRDLREAVKGGEFDKALEGLEQK